MKNKALVITVSDFRNPDFVKALKSLYESNIIELPDPIVGFYPDEPEYAEFEDIYQLWKDIEAI